MSVFCRVCDNKKPSYEVKTYSDVTCTTETTGSSEAMAATTLPAASYTYGGATVSLVSCGKCPPGNVDSGVVTYILAFFGVVFAYLMVLCVGMYALFSCGATCG